MLPRHPLMFPIVHPLMFPIVSTTDVSVTVSLTCTAAFDAMLTVTKNGGGTGTITSVPAGISCGPACAVATAPFDGSVQVTAVAEAGSVFLGWSGDCVGTAGVVSVNVDVNKNCGARFELARHTVRLRPFGPESGAGPYSVEVVSASFVVTPAPEDITVTLLREVISQCSGPLFSSNRTVTIAQGQTAAAYNFNAGHDPACSSLPITTRYRVTSAVLASGTPLDLSLVPSQELVLTVFR